MTQELREVVIAFDDDPTNEVQVTVALGLEVHEDTDEQVFFYFKDEAEMLDAMNGGSAINFRVVSL